MACIASGPRHIDLGQNSGMEKVRNNKLEGNFFLQSYNRYNRYLCGFKMKAN